MLIDRPDLFIVHIDHDLDRLGAVMLRVPDTELLRRLSFENPWWTDLAPLDHLLEGMRDRAYLAPFLELLAQTGARRAVVLMGPRRVGKTVILRQTIRHLIRHDGIDPVRILFASLDHPLYRGVPLDRLLTLFLEQGGHDRFADLVVMFDEIQYVEEWEAYLKAMVDDFPNIRFIVSGSAAAALRMKSRESGAGRFTDFLLPPLLFAEFMDFVGVSGHAPIDELNRHFIDYLNFGGFPEAILEPRIRADVQRYIASDILDKVLLRDLPSLYGIDNPNELHRLFANLVYNTGQEISISGLAQETGIPKNTLYKYVTFLEAAFLIHRLNRVDQFARRPKRDSGFKVYVTNPCLRAAMFGPVEADDPIMGAMAETALVAQLVHSEWVETCCYARWKEGEVDLVTMRIDGSVGDAQEVKWSDRILHDRADIRHLISFAKRHDLKDVRLISRTVSQEFEVDGIRVDVLPLALWCFAVGEVFARDQLRQGIRPRRLLPDD
jgi:predicted AAA+ superfamily ATPase